MRVTSKGITYQATAGPNSSVVLTPEIVRLTTGLTVHVKPREMPQMTLCACGRELWGRAYTEAGLCWACAYQPVRQTS